MHALMPGRTPPKQSEVGTLICAIWTGYWRHRGKYETTACGSGKNLHWLVFASGLIVGGGGGGQEANELTNEAKMGEIFTLPQV